MTVENIIVMSLAGLVLLVFLLLAATDLGMLVRRPQKLGTGLSRVWAVGRTTMLETWAGRIWLVPILWFAGSFIILLTIRPFDPSELIPLDIRVLLESQEILLLVVLWVMACVSLPRERERKIMVTNASKPLSRLEMLLGKIVGFSCMAFLMLLVMGTVSWGTLLVADHRLRSEANEEYLLGQKDYGKPGTQPASYSTQEAKKALAEHGSLVAYNSISVPNDNMSIVGWLERTPEGMVRFLKGGSQEQAIYRFGVDPRERHDPGIVSDVNPYAMPQGQRPYFLFSFPVEKWPGMTALPDPIKIQVTAVRAKQRLHPQEQTLTLHRAAPGFYQAYWEPEPSQSEQLFTFPGIVDNGEVEVDVTCLTPGVFLQVLDGKTVESGATIDDFNVVAFGSHNPSRPPDAPLLKPQVRGFERRDKQQIDGPTKQERRKYPKLPLEFAIFRFPGKDLAHVPVENGNFKLALLLDVDKEDNQDIDTTAQLSVYNDDAPTEGLTQDFSVKEKREDVIELPERMLGNADPAKRGDLVIMLDCKTEGHWISLAPDSVRIQQPQTPFVVNLLKSEAVIFCEAVLLIVICVCCSVPLGWPVAMLLAATCFVLGYLRPFIGDTIDYGGLLALSYPNYGVQSPMYHFFNTMFQSLWEILGFIIYMTPDFRHFDSLSFITSLQNMPWSVLFADLGWAGLYCLPFIGLGYLFIRKQELG